MNKYLTISIAAVVLLGLGGFLIHAYGKAKDTAGYNRAIAEYNAVSAKAGNQASKDLEGSQNEAKEYSDSGRIDDLLTGLGIMRKLEDR